MNQTCQILILHHDYQLLHNVLHQFEQSIINKKNGAIIGSKRTLCNVLTMTRQELNYDVSKVIVDFVNPPLKVFQSDMLLIFEDHFVGFDHQSLIDFASKNFKNCLLSKTCLIHLFGEMEAATLDPSLYSFSTRLYSSAFDRCHHIHLFVNDNDINKKSDFHGDGENKKALYLRIKQMSILPNWNVNHLTSFCSYYLLNYLLSTIVKHGKELNFGMSLKLDLVNKLRLRLNVVREIKSNINPMDLSSDSCMSDLLDHILKKNKHKYLSNAGLRTSYACI